MSSTYRPLATRTWADIPALFAGDTTRSWSDVKHDCPRRLVSFGGLTRSVPDGGEQPRNRGRIGHRSGGRSLSFGIFTRGFGAGKNGGVIRPQNTAFATSHLEGIRLVFADSITPLPNLDN